MIFNWIQSPCKDCTERHINCHSTCDKYKEYKVKHEAEASRVFKENSLNAKIGQLNYKAVKKNEKLPEALRHGRKTKR